MKKNTVAMCCVAGSMLALASGCGKSETQTAKPPETDKIAAKPEAASMGEKPAMQATNAVAAAAGAAMTEASTMQTGAMAKATDATTAAPAAAKPTDTTSAATTPPPAAAAPAAATMAGLSQNQMVQGLEEALGKGLQQAIAGLGHEGGFLTNLSVKIPMPEKLQTVEKTLRAMNEGKLVDDFVTTMNRAAEQAVPVASSVFADALKQMSIEDAKSILSGPDDAATQYFQKTTQTNLYAQFYPIVQKATAQTGVTAAYKNLMEKANVTSGLGGFGSSLGNSVLGKDAMDIDSYVTNKALDGLFKMVAQEEKQIRQNPVARTTATLQQVFGAFTK